jgi:hypothetical protein
VQTWTALTSDRWPPALCARSLAPSRYAWLRLRPVANRLIFSQVVSSVASLYLACRVSQGGHGKSGVESLDPCMLQMRHCPSSPGMDVPAWHGQHAFCVQRGRSGAATACQSD